MTAQPAAVSAAHPVDEGRHDERDTADRLIAHFLADQIDSEFDGRITGVTRSGLFVRLKDTGADGFVPASTIGADYYRFDEQLHALVRTELHRVVRALEALGGRDEEVA